MSPQSGALLAAKGRAFGVHFAISVALFAVIIAVAIRQWLPPPYFWIDGGILVVGVAAVVDLLVGPLLTMLVYRPGRRGLVYNLAAIAMLQAAALTWGIQVLYDGRPLIAAYVGFPRHEFFPMTRAMIERGPRSLADLLALSPERPALVYVPLPDDPEEARRTLEAGLGGGQGVLHHTELFLPLRDEALARVLAAGRSKADLERVWPGSATLVERYLADTATRLDEVALVPIYGRYSSALFVFDRRTSRLKAPIYLGAR